MYRNIILNIKNHNDVDISISRTIGVSLLWKGKAYMPNYDSLSGSHLYINTIWSLYCIFQNRAPFNFKHANHMTMTTSVHITLRQKET